MGIDRPKKSLLVALVAAVAVGVVLGWLVVFPVFEILTRVARLR